MIPSGSIPCLKSKAVLKYQEQLKKEVQAWCERVDELDEFIESKYDEYIHNANDDCKHWKEYNDSTRDASKERDELKRNIESAELELKDYVFLNYPCGSDYYPYEVVQMITKNKWLIRELEARPCSKDLEPNYVYNSNPDMETEFANRSSKRRNVFIANGDERMYINSEPHYYRDLSF